MLSFYFHLLSLNLLAVLANVEIVNFHHPSLPILSDLPRLTRLSHTFQLNITPPSPLTVAVDTSGWPSNSSFTLRASSSAAYPFNINVQLAQDGLAYLSVDNYGLPVPGRHVPSSVPLVLTLERLHWGVLPTSVLPTIISILLACFASRYWIAPRIHAHVLKYVLKFKKT
jgi:hypothetical protein